jgi:hypothetical protein
MLTTWGWRVAVITTILVVFGNAAGPNVVKTRMPHVLRMLTVPA